MQEKVEPLYPWVIPTTESQMALINLAECLALLSETPVRTIRDALRDLVLVREDREVEGVRALRALARQLNDLAFKLHLSESEVA